MISAEAGAVALGLSPGDDSIAASFGASLAMNVIGNTIEALIGASTVTGEGGDSGIGVSLNALGNATILATTVAAAGAVSGGEGSGLAGTGAGAGSSNTIN